MIGKILDNRYEIIEKIGGGGMALVYKAKCRLLNRYVAVKVLRPEFTCDEDFINKFGKESQAAASLSHPNIVNIYDVGTDNDIYYIVMEYVKGTTLKKYIKDNKQLSNEEVIKISKQIALALNHAHSNHIVHRDIKPHNILITEDGRVKVTDFGIARAITTSTVTNTGNVIGSVHYFSPEQARGGFVDEKSDIYSLGVTMYEMATGKMPFEGETPITVALKHLKEEVVPPTLLNNEISNGLESVILTAMQKDKNRRYSSALDLYNDLDQALLNPSQSVTSYIEDDESPTIVIPPIDDLTSNNNEKEDINYRKSKKYTLGYIVTILSAFILSILLVAAISYNVFKEKITIREVEIPNVINKSVEAVKNELDNLGLNVEVIKYDYSNEISEGYVIDQIPEFGEIVKKGYTVRLTVSKGSKKVNIPNLIHKELEEAKLIIENNNLQLGKIEYEYNDLPIGIILNQQPLPDLEADENSEINLVVSQGPEIQTVIMPNFVGKNIEDTKETAKALGLIISNIHYEKNEELEKDVVISQSIEAGTEIKENSVFSLTVSQGPEMIEQPPEENELPTETIKKTLIIPLSFDKNQEIVKVIKTQNGNSKVIYESTHNKNEETIRINVTGAGTVKFDVYFGERLVYSKEEQFE